MEWRNSHTPQHIPVMAPMIQREILYYILRSRHGAQLRNLAQIDGADDIELLYTDRCPFLDVLR